MDCKHVEILSQLWQGSLQWICASPVRPKHPRKNWYIGVFRMPEMPEMPSESEIEFQTCRSGGKGGQHVNKTESAVRATHKASGISVRVESERSQHANKKLALTLLAQKLAEHPDRPTITPAHSTAGFIRWNAAIRNGRSSERNLRRSRILNVELRQPLWQSRHPPCF